MFISVICEWNEYLVFRKSPKPQQEKAGKKPRVWDLGGSPKDLKSLERTIDKPENVENNFTPNTEVIILFYFTFITFRNFAYYSWLEKCKAV